MSLEAIEKVTEVERKNKERRAAAETEAKQMLASAQRDGLALLEQMRAEEAAKGAELLRQAEEESLVIDACEDIPKSFLVCDHPYHPQLVYLSELSSATLQRRMEEQQ